MYQGVPCRVSSFFSSSQSCFSSFSGAKWNAWRDRMSLNINILISNHFLLWHLRLFLQKYTLHSQLKFVGNNVKCETMQYIFFGQSLNLPYFCVLYRGNSIKFQVLRQPFTTLVMEVIRQQYHLIAVVLIIWHWLQITDNIQPLTFSMAENAVIFTVLVFLYMMWHMLPV